MSEPPQNQTAPRATRSPSIQRRLLIGVLAIMLLALVGQAMVGEYYRNEMWQQEFENRCLRALSGLKRRLPMMLFRKVAEQRGQGKTPSNKHLWPLGGEEGLDVDGLAFYRLKIEMGDQTFLLQSQADAPEITSRKEISVSHGMRAFAGSLHTPDGKISIQSYALNPPRKPEELRREHDGARREREARPEAPVRPSSERDPRRGRGPGAERDDDTRGRFARRMPVMRELVVYFDASELAERRAEYRLMAAGIMGGVLLVTSLLLLVLVRGSLRGVRKLCGQIEQLDVSKLAPVSPEGLPRELLGVTETLNDAIGRLDESYRREKAFSDNVAHELRTPIAVVCNEAELALRKPRDVAVYHQSLEHILDSARLQQGLVDKLLHLSRLEGRRVGITASEFDLAMQARRSLDDATAVAGREDLAVETDLQPAPIHSDHILLSQAIGNLLDNALAYAAPDSTVWVRTSEADGHCVFEVSNTTTSLQEADLAQLTQRFWRKDVARSEAVLHAGLGLTLVEQLTQCLGGELSFSLEGNVLTARIDLPATQNL